MKSTGIIRRIDDLGRVTLPKELRRTRDIKDGDPLEIFVEDDKIILRKYSPELPTNIIAELKKTLAGRHNAKEISACIGYLEELIKN